MPDPAVDELQQWFDSQIKSKTPEQLQQQAEAARDDEFANYVKNRFLAASASTVGNALQTFFPSNYAGQQFKNWGQDLNTAAEESNPGGASVTALDVAFAVPHGLYRFNQSLGGMADSIAEGVGLDLIKDNRTLDYDPAGLAPTTIVGGLASGFTQFAAGYALAGVGIGALGTGVRGLAAARGIALGADATLSEALVGSSAAERLYTAAGKVWGLKTALTIADTGASTALGLAPEAKAVTGLKSIYGTAAGWAQTAERAFSGVLKGGVADFIAWSDKQDRLSQEAVKFGGPFDNFLTRWLADHEGDSWLEGRLKNLIEGGILGTVFEAGVTPVARAAMRGIKAKSLEYMKFAREAEQAAAKGDLEKVAQIAEQAKTMEDGIQEDLKSTSTSDGPVNSELSGLTNEELAKRRQGAIARLAEWEPETTKAEALAAGHPELEGQIPYSFDPIAEKARQDLYALNGEITRRERIVDLSNLTSSDAASRLVENFIQTGGRSEYPTKLLSDYERFLKGGKVAADTKPILEELQSHIAGVYRRMYDAGPIQKDMLNELERLVGFKQLSESGQLAKDLLLDIEAGKGSGLDPQTALRVSLDEKLSATRLKAPEEVMNALRALEQVTQTLVDKNTGGVQTLEQTKDIMRTYVKDPAKLIRFLEGDAEQVKNLAARVQAGHELGLAFTRRITKMLQQAGADGVSPLVSEQLSNDAAQLWKAHSYLSELTRTVQKEAARVPSSGRIVKQGLTGSLKSFDEALSHQKQTIDSISEAIKTRLSADPAAKVSETIKSIVEGKNGSMDPKTLVKIFQASQQTNQIPRLISLLDHANEGWFNRALRVHNEMWQASVLSGIKTFTTNFIGNAINTIQMPLERFAGAAWMRSGAEMQQAGRFALELGGVLKDFLNLTNVSDMRESVWKSFKSERNQLDVVNGLREENSFAIAAKGDSLGASAVNTVGKVVRLPFRINGTVDEFFKQLNYRAYVRTQALTEGLAQNLAGKELSEFVSTAEKSAFDVKTGGAIIGNEGKFLFEDALKYSRESTYSQDLLEGTLGKTVHDAVVKHPILRMFLPFVRTPTNIFRKAVRLMPGVNLLQQEYRTRLTSGTAEQMARAKGEMMLGTVLTSSALLAAVNGRITGGGPRNQAERDNLMATGWRPYSVVTDNGDGTKSFTSFLRFDPWATVLGLVADLHESAGQLRDDHYREFATGIVLAVAKNTTNKTYLQSLRDMTNVLAPTDERQVERILQNRVASYIPSLSGQIAAADDLYMREARTTLDAIKRRLPGYSKDLPPRRNALGEPITPDGGFTGFFDPFTSPMRVVSPAAYSKSVDDPVKREMARLSYGFGKPQQKMEGVDLTLLKNSGGQDAFDRYVELQGQVKLGGKTLAQSLSKLIQSPHYNRLPYPDGPQDSMNPRVKEIQSVIGDYRERAKLRLKAEFPEINAQAKELSRRARLGGQTQTSIVDRLGL